MKKSLTILDALDDPRLFGPWFRGKSWGAWRAFLAALFGLEMSDSEAMVFRTHTGRQTVPTAAFREAWLCCGRRAGKSLTSAPRAPEKLANRVHVHGVQARLRNIQD